MYLYPFFIRFWHLVNAICFILLILTGFSMKFAHPAEPSIFLSRTYAWHKVSGIILSVNYLIFFLGNMVTDNGKHYRIRFKGYGARLMRQIGYYRSGLFKGQSPPFPAQASDKFNPLQKLSYITIMYIGMPLIILTGVGLLIPELIKELGKSMIPVTDILHLVLAYVLTVFLVFHIAMSFLGPQPAANLRSIVSGYSSH